MSTPAKHTPGSWKVRAVDLPNFLQVEHCDNLGNRSILCRISDHDLCPEHGEILLNSVLIAAAPDLLESLEEVVAIADRKTDAFDRARAAIAKAKGEA